MSFAAEKQQNPKQNTGGLRALKKQLFAVGKLKGQCPCFQENTLLSPPWLPSSGVGGIRSLSKEGKKQHTTGGEHKIFSAAVPGNSQLSLLQACGAHLLAYLFGYLFGCGGQRHTVEPVLS